MNITPLYYTNFGSAFVGNSLELLPHIADESIDLVITSPPFALRRQKAYGNVQEHDYVNWIKPFAKEIKRVLKNTGSFVLDLGGAYQQGIPARSLYNFRVLLTLCDEIGFFLAEDFYWYNPSKLPSPIEWVNKRKIRVKDAINTVWWFSKSENPKSDISKVLTPYSERMKKLIKDPEKFYKPDIRPSGHSISSSFGKDNGGAIPSNLLSISNTDSGSSYLRLCKALKIERHPARFPMDLPSFFIKMLTNENDIVLDIFSGSNTTGYVAENLNRKWLSFELNHDYLSSSIFRFLDGNDIKKAKCVFSKLNKQHANYYLKEIHKNGTFKKDHDRDGDYIPKSLWDIPTNVDTVCVHIRTS